MHIVSAASWSALSLMCYEKAITFDTEVEILRTPRWGLVTVLYLFTRYYPLVMQITNHFLILNMQSKYPVPMHMCRTWWIYQTIVGHTTMISVELILMLRVHALYNRSFRIGFILSLALLGEIIVICICGRRTLTIVNFDAVCAVAGKIPRDAIYLAAGPVFTQTVILALTALKHLFAIRQGWGRTPLVSLMVRDGALVFVVISTLLALTLIFVVTQDTLTQILFFLFVSVVPALGCRLIANMQQLATHRVTHADDSIHLSTDLHSQ